MALEIERKFLVIDDSWRSGVTETKNYRQGYLCQGPNPSIRVRTDGVKAWLNLKSSSDGLTRNEYEYAISLIDAEEMLDHMIVLPIVEKKRYLVPCGRHTWEIDVFEGSNAGLVVAELELEHADERLDLPPWVGTEVTYDMRFYNMSLATRPYSQWSEDKPVP